MQIIYGFILAIIVAYGAYRARSLSRSGAFAATFVGTVIFGIGGWQWAVLLLTFFITSSGLSRAFRKRKAGLNEKFSKGNERDAGQVFGNGGLATFFAALHAFYPESILPWIGFAASLAAVNADTWATELGVLNPTPPAHDHRYEKARRKRDLRRDLIIWDTRLASRFHGDRRAGCMGLPCWNAKHQVLLTHYYGRAGGLALRLSSRRDRARHVLLPHRSKRD